MRPVKQLSETDTLFVAAESGASYNHTAGLLLLDAGGKSGLGFAQFREKAIERIDRLPLFRWKLHELPLGLDLPYWVEDERFNYRHHIKQMAVPAPGDIRALSDIVAQLFSKHMDRNKPLWEVWFIEGVEGGGAAVMFKLHHCMMDGQGAMKLLEILCDTELDAPLREVPAGIAAASAGRVPSLLESSLRTSLSLARKPAEVGQMVAGLMLPRLRESLGRARPKDKKRPAFLPHPILNADIGAERGFVFGSLALDDVKIVNSHFNVSVNEVVLAVAGTALRAYLAKQGSPISPALRATMPISLRTSEDEGFENRVTTANIGLATDIDDPVARLQEIHRESQEVKSAARSGGKGVTDILQVLPPLLVSALAHSVNPDQAAQIVGANLAVSNVRGSSTPVYLAGARVETLYPMSVIAPGIGLNITCVGYAGKLDFGLTLDPDVFPDAWSLMSEMEVALADYLALCGHKPRRRKAPVRRKKAAGKRRPRVSKK